MLSMILSCLLAVAPGVDRGPAAEMLAEGPEVRGLAPYVSCDGETALLMLYRPPGFGADGGELRVVVLADNGEEQRAGVVTAAWVATWSGEVVSYRLEPGVAVLPDGLLAELAVDDLGRVLLRLETDLDLAVCSARWALESGGLVSVGVVP